MLITTKLDAVYNILRENIVNGNLKPGTRLIIRKIARQLGVSIIPVREAIRSLEAHGLVTMIPYAGAHVSRLDENNIKEIVEVRSVLEGYAARLAIPLSDVVAAELRVCIDGMRECVKRDDFVQFGVLNQKFHQTIYEQISNKRIQKMINETIRESERTRSVFGLSARRSEEALKEHEEILQELLAGDKDKVEYLIRNHRRRAGQALIDNIEGG